MRIKQEITLDHKKILITGSPGFIGSNLAVKLLKSICSSTLISLDNMNDYYDPSLKRYRLGIIEKAAAISRSDHIFIQGDITDRALVFETFEKYRPDVVVNLAAQAGVRYSIENPEAYINSNIIGFYNILEACRHKGVDHLVYASSSSVYGNNNDIPFSTDDKTDSPVSLYAATKKSNELMAHSYSSLYGIPCTGLRFFTVYGPAGRPDMFYYSATEKMMNGETIKVFNYGNCKRDFTYIDDITEGIIKVMKKAPSVSCACTGAPHSVYNIGKGSPVDLMEFICTLKDALITCGLLSNDYSVEKHIELLPMQPGDVSLTYANTAGLEKDFDYHPQTSIDDGLMRFAEWYRVYKKL